ncbi:MAG: T9SS type A sorting domain-containing protein, partial [Flavobacteriales bacterium]
WRNNDAGNYPYNNSQERTNIGWEAFTDTSLNAISCMDVSTSPANTVYLGTQRSLVYRIDNANVGDPELVQLSSLGIGNNKYISAVEVDPTNSDRVLVLASNYSTYSIVFTDNGGQSWKRVAGNLEDNIAGGGNGPSMRTAEIAVLGSDTLYIVGGSTGLYATDKLEGNDTEWTQIGTEIIGNVVVENIRYRESDGKLIVGTHGTGVYSTIITSIYDVLPDLVGIKEMDDNTKLSVFPNPATDKAIVEWSNDIVVNSIIVSDASGKVVLSQKTNKNSVQLQTSDWEKGIYFITLKGEQVEQTQKLVIH